MNPTTQTIVDRLPNKPILIPAEVASAFGMSDGGPIIAEIKRGRIAASYVGGKFYIARAEAARYVAETEYRAEEA